MEPRAFADWSPASVFGATVSAKGPVRYDAKSPGFRGEGVVPATRSENNHEEIAQSSEVRSLLCASRTKVFAPEDAEEDRDEDPEAREDDAARLLQKHVRVWLLYRRELESLHRVEQLRHELEQVAASAIADWLRRSGRRFMVLNHAAELRRQREAQQKAKGECLVRWLHWQLCIARARRTLQRRIAARRCLVFWWRRWALNERCVQRRRVKVERERTTRDHASHKICRFVRRVARQRHARREAAESLQAFVWKHALRRRAVQEALRRRDHRLGVLRVDRVLTRWGLRHTVTCWREFTRRHREAESLRRHDAACVLQRLVRVVLTAFRLLRRRDAATRIQSRVRAFQQQRHYATLRHTRRRLAATQIQRIVRGYAARKRFARLLQQLRERFKCQNCGLIEPGGLYCKFCGRRRTTFDVLHAGIAAGVCTTDAKLRKKRRKATVTEDEISPSPPPAPPVGTRKRDNGPSVWVMAMPELAPSSPSRALPAVSSAPRVIHQEMVLPSPIPPPRKPANVRAASGRPSIHHRSLSLTQAPTMAPMMGLVSADKTRQRAEALLQRDLGDRSATMELHLKRLQKGGKAASR